MSDAVDNLWCGAVVEADEVAGLTSLVFVPSQELGIFFVGVVGRKKSGCL
jgi:hypothetical protein